MNRTSTVHLLRILVVAAFTSVLPGCASRQLTDDRELVGTWRLVSRVDRAADGRTLIEPSLSSDPVSLLIYDRAGNVAAQLMRRDRTAIPATAAGDPNNSGAVNGYDAYFGTYAVDGSAGTVTHTLVAALVPGDVGRQLVRRFRFENGDLIISFDARGPTGEQVTRTLTWRRVDR